VSSQELGVSAVKKTPQATTKASRRSPNAYRKGWLEEMCLGNMAGWEEPMEVS